MLLHFDDATSLTGARLWRRDKLIILYGLHHTLELQCIAGPNNDPVDMESKNCTRWELTITPSLASPSLVLASASYSENIAVGDTLSFDFSTATVEMYRYVAGNATAPGVFQLLGYEGSEDVATVAIQFLVILRTTTVNPCPPDITTALMNEIQRAADSTTSAANATSSAELAVASMGGEIASMSSSVSSGASMVSSALEGVSSMSSSVAGMSSSVESIAYNIESMGSGIASEALELSSAISSASGMVSEAVAAASQASDDALLASAYASAADSAMHNASNRSEEADEYAISASAMASAATSAAASAGDAVASRFASAISGVDSYVSLAQEAATQTASNANVVMSIAENIGSGGSPEWGRITGTLSSQADLSSALAEKIDSTEKGAANGVASLDSNGLVPSMELPIGDNINNGTFKVSRQNGVDVVSSTKSLRIIRALPTDIDGRTNQNNPIVPIDLDYAVRSVLPNVTTIPAATTAYSLLDASATTNNHSWQYFHAPAEASTYTFPAVTDTSVAHYIKLTIDFTTVQTYAFEDSEGTAIAPLFTPTIAAGDVYEFDCEYSAVKSTWLIWPHKQGAVSDDYVMQAEVGAANGVASLNSNGKLPESQLTYGLNYTNGVYVYGNDLATYPANDSLINTRTSGGHGEIYRPICPSRLNYAVTAALTDANHITLTSEQQQTAQSVLGASGVLHSSGAPTTSTVGKLLDRYEDDDTQKTYTCTAITNTGTEQEPVWEYTWTDDVNAKGGRIMGGTLVVTRASDPTTDAYSTVIKSTGRIAGGFMATAPGEYGAIAIGYYINVGGGQGTAGFGAGIEANYNSQLVTGIYNVRADVARITGKGVNNNLRHNIEELDWNGNLYIAGGHQQGITTIPSATTAYTLVEGSFQHTPSTASTYTLPAIIGKIVADGRYFIRNPATDGTGYYGWLSGTTNRYTASATPAVGDNTYTNTALTSGAKPITAIDNRTHEITLDVEFAAYARYSDGDSGSAYAWKHGSDILYTDTTTIVAATTKAYSDTALTTEAGTIALYDSTANAFAMCSSVAFEDANGATIVPKPMAGSIKVGTIVQYLCEWCALTSEWVIYPIMVKEGA